MTDDSTSGLFENCLKGPYNICALLIAPPGRTVVGVCKRLSTSYPRER
jgi:hypothetical protein